jgi:AmmeMemoRadiSam system protein B
MKILRIILFFCIIFGAGFLFGKIFVSTNGQDSSKVHYSTKDPQTVNSAIARIGAVEKIDGASSAVVNHHLLAPDLIAGTLARVGTGEPITVILVSPNHFARGNGQITTSRLDWSTPFGLLPIDQEAVDFLAQGGLAEVDEYPFAEEHGIYNVVPFIKKFFPKAKIVPLILKDSLQNEKIDLLAKSLAEIPNAFVVFSIDFSHYQTKEVADMHDSAAVKVIEARDYDNIKNLDVDSKRAIRLMLKYAELKSTPDFRVLYHSNSANYTGNKKETTSYIDGVFEAR